MKCNYPACKLKASKTWASVPLCEGHHETIEAETLKFYNGRNPKTENEQRPHYMRISHLIPWSKTNLKVGVWK